MLKLQSINKKLLEFFKEGMKSSWENAHYWDADEIEDFANRLGFLKEVPYDPEKHGEIAATVEPGETIFEFSPEIQELIDSYAEKPEGKNDANTKTD